jgi:hypothetical protein
MEKLVPGVVSAVRTLALMGVFCKMKPGIGPNNLQAVGIVLVAFLASVLSILRPDGLNAAMGILGAIGGYLFGMKSGSSTQKARDQETTTKQEAQTNAPSASSSPITP